jgi:UDP-N-acetylglucosamine pyrophosphorylase
MGMFFFRMHIPLTHFSVIGMKGAKSALEVKNDMTFLDLTVRQIEYLNTDKQVDVPLILMTSFNTHEDTKRIIEKYENQVRISTFKQSRYPRILKEKMLPCPNTEGDDNKEWYPPGHGDLYESLMRSGVLDQLLADGKEYLFVSNSDNLGAVSVFYLVIALICICCLPSTGLKQRGSKHTTAHGGHEGRVLDGGHG